MLKKIILGLIILSIVTSVAIGNYLLKTVERPLQISEPNVSYQVKPGYSLKRVLNEFETQGWISQARIHEVWLRYNQLTKIQKGEYVLTDNMTSTDAVLKMINGEKILRSVQFIEGKRVSDYLLVLRDNPFVEQTLEGKTLQEITSLISEDIAFHEGWIFPDTYFFEKGTTDLELLQTAYQQMKRILNEEWANKAENAEVETPYEALILASIIEKETGAAYERPMISGVFTKRLQLDMRLQTDPTVIYGLGEGFDGNLTRSHLRTDTPYNTYTRKGLPPTPIANPGREAIRAAVNPQVTEAIFFVAKGDGTHHFSETYEEHNAAVKQYQRFGRRSDYQSAPAPSEGQ